jgi:hypothetical protein
MLYTYRISWKFLCIYLMENIVWNGSYSDCTGLTVTLSVGIGHRLFNKTQDITFEYVCDCSTSSRVQHTLHRCTGCFAQPVLRLLRHISGLESNDGRN